MSFVGNLLWIIFGGGIFIFLEYLVGGIALCLTIVGIPFGIQCIKLSILGLAPFGVRVVDYGRGSGFLSLVMNIIWLFIGGIWIALTHLILAFLLGITIIGLPFAKQHLKFAGLSLAPFGKELR